MALSEGQLFAGYRILRQLGSGGMGEVYLAQHPRLPRHDALKLLPPEWSADAEYRARFTREADLASTLWHPNIVGVHDRGEADGQLWISMDFVDGLDAAKLLAQRYPAGMPVDEVARIVSAVASALDAAHKRGLLHRDVKPANIMLTHVDDDEEQRVLLTDFGIARNANDISGLTATNMTVGTVAYCAPEQLLGEEIDGRTDQYALAATAYHLLTGAPLFANSNPAVVISRHLNNAPPALADTRAELAKLDSVLAAGLAKQPDDRFQRCGDFARAFNEQSGPAVKPAAAATTPAAVRRSKPVAAPAQSPASVDKKRHWISATVAIVAIVVAVLGVLVWRPWHSETSANPPRSQPSPTTTVSGPVPVQSSLVRPPPPPPPPPTVSADALDDALLSDTELSRILGVAVTGDPSGGGGGGLALDSAYYGTSDHSDQVTPRSCVGIVFTGEHEVFEPAGATELKTRTYGSLYGRSNGEPHLLQQTAAVFPSASDAEGFVATSQTQWETCANTEVSAILGYENGAGYVIGSVQRDGDIMTIAMAKNDGLNGPGACQQALGVRLNMVVEVRTCEVPVGAIAYGPSQGFPKDPKWATPYAERLVGEMLQTVAAR
jgi:serine/threonine protein kinase